MTLLSPDQLAAIQSLGASGLTTDVMILAKTNVETDSGHKETWATTGPVVKGWLVEKTGQTVAIGVTAGAKTISENFILRLPIGTAVSSGDHVLIAGATYTVEHDDRENTYPNWLSCSVRKLV